MRQVPSANRLDEHMRRALNKIRKLSTAEEFSEVLNRDLGPGDPPFPSERSVDLVAERDRRCIEFVLA
jgi:hypothetical protein